MISYNSIAVDYVELTMLSCGFIYSFIKELIKVV